MQRHRERREKRREFWFEAEEYDRGLPETDQTTGLPDRQYTEME